MDDYILIIFDFKYGFNFFLRKYFSTCIYWQPLFFWWTERLGSWGNWHQCSQWADRRTGEDDTSQWVVSTHAGTARNVSNARAVLHAAVCGQGSGHGHYWYWNRQQYIQYGRRCLFHRQEVYQVSFLFQESTIVSLFVLTICRSCYKWAIYILCSTALLLIGRIGQLLTVHQGFLLKIYFIYNS